MLPVRKFGNNQYQCPIGHWKLAALALATLATFNTLFAEPTGCPDFDVELPRTDNTRTAVVRAVD